MYGWIFGVSAAAILSALLWNSERLRDNQKELLAQLRLDVHTAVEANLTVNQTLQVCKEVNAFNADQRDQALRLGLQSEEKVKALALLLQESIENQISETDFQDSECRLLSDPLPGDFTNSLCFGTANCGNTDRNSSH